MVLVGIVLQWRSHFGYSCVSTKCQIAVAMQYMILLLNSVAAGIMAEV